MAHLPQELLPAGAGFSKTLFAANGKSRAAAVLVQQRGKQMSKREMSFPDAHAALDWCLKAGVNFYCFPAATPAQN